MNITCRASKRGVALETTLLTHGVPRDAARPLADQLADIVRAHRVDPALVGIISGRPTVGLTDAELDGLLQSDHITKVNTSNMGVVIHRGSMGSTTVSATMELCSIARVRVFATGGIGGLHHGFGQHLDVSSDLAALARFPVAVVGSGVKALLDVPSTREALEALGVPVVGYQTDRFPAFYLRDGGADVDATFDDVQDLAAFIDAELKRTGRGVLVANPISPSHEISRKDWDAWIAKATEAARNATGRDATPAILKQLHEVSDGRTLDANIALAKSNTDLAARICAAMPGELE
jgi:pseudouridylate synthase